LFLFTSSTQTIVIAIIAIVVAFKQNSFGSEIPKIMILAINLRKDLLDQINF